MPKQLNQLNLIGRVVREPEVKYSQSGSAYCLVTLACADDYYDKKSEEWVNRANFIPFTFFGNSAERIGKTSKGDLIQVTAKVANNNYENSDGNTVYGYTFQVEQFDVLYRVTNGEESEKPAPKNNQPKGKKPSGNKGKSSKNDNPFEEIPF